jgi:carbamoyl-phosphate synthase large subunit
MTVISWNRTRRVTSLDVLVTAASRRVPLVKAFRDALASTGLRGRVLVTDVNPLSPAVHVADGWHRVPLATDPAYVDELVALCRHERVSLLVPTIDDELEVLSCAVERFAGVGTRVAVSPETTNRICNDKYDTCEFLRARGIPAAESFLPLQLPLEPRFPLFVKPRVGRGGVSAFPVRNARELEFFLEYVETPIVQEYLDGPEFTIDILCDFDGRPLAIVPRERVVIRAGVIDRGRTVHEDRLIDLARRVVGVLHFVGAVNVQCRLVGGEPVVFEINPRFSGGIPLTIAAGADFPRLLVELTAGRRVAPAVGEFQGDLWMTNYESSIFLDGSTLRRARLGRGVAVGEVA